MLAKHIHNAPESDDLYILVRPTHFSQTISIKSTQKSEYETAIAN
jgi:hypothetical protein